MATQSAEDQPTAVEKTAAVAGLQSAALARYLTHRILDALNRALRRLQVYIGWRKEITNGQAELVARPFLPAAFTGDAAHSEANTDYRQLFSLDPIDGEAVLVGRERELNAIIEAHDLWRGGRPVSIGITGQRGSGKTSLINRAIGRSFSDLEVVRGAFDERITSEVQLRAFLSRLIGIDDSSQLETSLAAQRRVIVLEDLERAFLRQVGHYAAVRALQRLIAAGSATLWILVINKVAFRFLDSAVGLGHSFSHRINAGRVDSTVLREAILHRHDLSGRPLEFSSPVSKYKGPAWFGAMDSVNARPENKFFEELAIESAGVFRAAFAIWLGHVDAVNPDSVVIRPLVSQKVSEVAGHLDSDNLFALMALMQHGSLTAEEHATIFQQRLTSSQAQLDELLAREIVQPDPARPGFRVRPEALRIVQESLYHRNML